MLEISANNLGNAQKLEGELCILMVAATFRK